MAKVLVIQEDYDDEYTWYIAEGELQYADDIDETLKSGTVTASSIEEAAAKVAAELSQ